MGIEDDIAASLPTPPLPAPARRAAAIEQALRRFDGLGDVEQAPPAGSRVARRQPFRILTSPYAGAFLSLMLVALVGAPVLWESMRDPILTSGDKDMAERSAPAAERVGVPAASSSATDVARNGPSADAKPSLDDPGPAPEPPAVAGGGVPTPSPAMVDEAPLSQSGASADEHIVVTGRRQPLQQSVEMKRKAATIVDQIAADPARETDTATGEKGAARTRGLVSPMAAKALHAEAADEAEDASIIITGTRLLARGDWNACTVDDPSRDLAACRLPDPAARGSAGTAKTHLAEGLVNAWRGNLDAAISAFDRAIAAAPRSSAAYLNRGLAYRRDGDLDRALADFDRAVRYGPRDARTYYSRSQVLRQQGADSRAAADERKAIALDPAYGAIIR